MSLKLYLIIVYNLDNWPSFEANIKNNSIYNINNTFEDETCESSSFIAKFSCIDRLINSISKSLEWKFRVEIIKINRELKNVQASKGKTRSAIRKSSKLIESLKERKRDIFRSIDKMRTDYKKHEATVIRIGQKESFKTEYKDLKNG